ncbi:hypothetical protein ACHRVK_21090 [Flavobacterium plurextorum]|uniref:hypothetical protein n=1 Tax=Flavobacterium plurextorum TaxID=1114867 RepID=UPI0037576878
MKVYIYILFFVWSLNIYSQDNMAVEKNQFKVNILLPGFVYEHGFNAKNTLYSELSLGFGYKSSHYGGSSWSFYPTINEQFRHYYNLDKRAEKGKRTAHNSGNFIALNAVYNFKSISSNNDFIEDASSFTIAPVWGLQRTYSGNFNLGLNAGIGYNFDKYESKLVPVINFTLGWVIK